MTWGFTSEPTWIEPIVCELLQKRMRATAWHAAFALSGLGAHAKDAQASAVFVRCSIEQVYVHLMVRNASIGRVLHDFKSSVERLLEALEVRRIVHPDREVQIAAFVQNL